MIPVNPFHPKRLFSVLLYGAAALVITAAVLVTSARLLLPSLDSYRSAVERAASVAIGQPVTISGLDAELIGFSPAVIFADVSLRDDRGLAMLHAAGLRVELDLPASVRQGRLVIARLGIRGAHLGVERTADGLFQVVGLGRQQDSGGSLDHWLLQQGRVTISDSRLTWIDAGVVRHFEAIEAELTTSGERHQLVATVVLPESMGKRAQVALDFTGDPLKLASWDGSLFVGLDAIRPTALMGERRFAGIRLVEGTVDAAIWSTWRKGDLQQVEARWAVDLASLERQGNQFGLERAAADLRWERQEEGWRLSLSDLAIRRNGHDWEPGRMQLTRSAGQTQFAADFVRLGDVAAAAPLLEALDPQRALLEALAPTGDLRRFSVTVKPGSYRVQTAFEALSVQPGARTPGLRGLDGELVWGGEGGQLRLASREGSLTFPQLFREPLPFTELNGGLRIARGAESWLVQGRGLRLVNEDIGARVALELAIPSDGSSPFLDLRAAFANGRGTAVPRYLPTTIMPAKAVTWLDAAFRRGRVVQGTALVHGRLGDFPFRQGQGRFEVRFEAQGVELAYRDGWPVLSDLGAEVVFDGPSMRITGRQGRFLGGKLTAADVRIPDMRRARLVIDGGGDVPAADVLYTLRETPLADRFGPAIGQLAAEGEAGLKLHLEFPLSAAEQADPVVRGALTLRQARLHIAERVSIDDLKGTVHFAASEFTADAISARMFGRPLALDVVTEKGRTVISAAGAATSARLQVMKLPYLEYLDGETAWNGTLSIPHLPEGEAELEVNTSLEGMAVRLPTPLAKSRAQHRNLRIGYRLSGGRAGQFEIAYADALRASLASREGRLVRGAIHFGTRMPDLPKREALRVTGSLTGVRPGEWHRIFAGLGEAGPALATEVDLYRLQLQSDGRDGASALPTQLPPLQLAIERLELDTQGIGALHLSATPVRAGTRFSDLKLRGSHFLIEGKGRWRHAGSGETRLDLRLTSPDLGDMMQELGFATVITDGRVEANGTLYWKGPPPAFSLDRLSGRLQLSVAEGVVDDVEPGGGRLLGLFSLQALPQRLRLDFRDFLNKGLSFHSLAGDLRIQDGQVQTENLLMDAPSAEVLMAGRTGLVAQDYDLLVTVIPNLGDSVAVAGGLALGPQTGALLWLLQKLLRVDKASTIRYTVEGSWREPVITRRSAERVDDPQR